MKSLGRPDEPVRQTRRLTAAQKAAIIISVLGKEAAKPVLAQLDFEQLRLFGQTMATLGEVSEDMVALVIDEFQLAVRSRESSLRGNAHQALDFLTGLVSDAEISRLRFELDSGNSLGPWERIGELEASQLAEVLAGEHPQVAAIVLSKIPAELSAAIITALPAETAHEVVQAIAHTADADTATVDVIGRSIAERFSASTRAATFQHPPADRVTAMLNYASGFTRDAVLEHLQAVDPAFAGEVTKKLFTFTDIPTRIDKKDVAKITRAVDQGVLLKALAGAAGKNIPAKDFILANISTRLAEQMNEAIAELGNVKVQDADAAQTEIVRAIRKLETSGELALLDPDQE